MQSKKDNESEFKKEFENSPNIRNPRNELDTPEITTIEIPHAVQEILSRIEQAQLLRAREDINTQLNHIMNNVQRIMSRYGSDFPLQSERALSLKERMKNQRTMFLEKMASYARNVEMRDNTLTYILAWLEEWNAILSDITETDIEEHYHWIVQMELFPDTLRAIENNVNILCKISTSLLKEKKKQKKKALSRGALWKTWKERAVKRPATIHALRPDQMIADQFAVTTKVAEIQTMLQELTGSGIFNKMENNAIRYISSTILNLWKALTTVNDELKAINVQSSSMFIETYETEKEVSQKMIHDLSEQNEMLQQKLQAVEENYEQHIQVKDTKAYREHTPSPVSTAIAKDGDREDSLSTILDNEFKDILEKFKTKEPSAPGKKWDSALLSTFPDETSPDVAERHRLSQEKQKGTSRLSEEVPEDKIALKKEDVDQKAGSDQYEPLPGKHAKGLHGKRTSRSRLLEDKGEDRVAELTPDQYAAPQTPEKNRREMRPFSDSKRQPFPSAETKSQDGRSATSGMQEKHRKPPSQPLADKSPSLQEDIEPADRQGESEASGFSESLKMTQLKHTSVPLRAEIEGKTQPTSTSAIISKEGKTKDKETSVKSPKPDKTYSRGAKVTPESVKDLDASESTSERRSSTETFQKAIMTFLKEKIENIRKPSEGQAMRQEEDESLNATETEQLGMIKEKIEEYFQNVTEIVAEILRKYKQQLTQTPVTSKKEVSFKPETYYQKLPTSAKSELSTFLSNDSVDPMIKNLIQMILTEVESQRDTTTPSTAERDHEKETQSQKEHLQENQEETYEEVSPPKKNRKATNKNLRKKNKSSQKEEEEEEGEETQGPERRPGGEGWDQGQTEENELQRQRAKRREEPKSSPLQEAQRHTAREDRGKQKEYEETRTQVPRAARHPELKITGKREGRQKPRLEHLDRQREHAAKDHKLEEKKYEELLNTEAQTPLTSDEPPSPQGSRPTGYSQIPPKTMQSLSSIPHTTTQASPNAPLPSYQHAFLKQQAPIARETQALMPTPTPKGVYTQGTPLMPAQLQPLRPTLAPQGVQALGTTLTTQQFQALMPTLTLQEVQALGTAMTTQQLQALMPTLTPQEVQALGTTLTTQQLQALMPTLIPQEVQAPGTTLTPQQAQALGTALTPAQLQALITILTAQKVQDIGATLTQAQLQALMSTLTPQEVQALGTTLTPQQAQALGTTLTPAQLQALMHTLTPQQAQAQALGTTLTPQQVQSLGITLTPQQAQALGTILTSAQLQVLTSTQTPPEVQAQGTPPTPQQAQTLETTLTTQELMALIPTPRIQEVQTLGTALTPQQAQALMTALTSIQNKALETTLATQQAHAEGTTLTLPQVETLGTALTPQQAQDLGTALSPPQAKTLGTTVTTQQAQILTTTLTPQETQAQGIPLTPQQAQALTATLTPQQAQAVRTTLPIQQAQAPGTTLPIQQAQAVGTTLPIQQAQALGTTLPIQQAQALGTTLPTQQAQTLITSMTPQQVQATITILTPEQAQVLGTSLLPQEVQAPMTTQTLQQAHVSGTILTPQQDQVLGTSLTPQEVQVLMTTLTPQEVQDLGTTLTPQQAQAPITTLTPEQAQVLGTSTTPQEVQALGTTLTTPQQVQALETTLTPQQVQAPTTTLTPQQAQILGKILTPQLAQALGTTITSQQIEALQTTLIPQQVQALTTTLTSQQVQAPMTTLTILQQAQVLETTLTPQQVQALETTLTPQQAQVLETTLTPEQAQALETTLTPEQVQALETTLTPEQVQALETTLTPEQAQVLETTLTPQQVQALETTLTPEQVQALTTTLTSQQVQSPMTILSTPQQVQALGTTLLPLQAQALEATLTPQQAQALTTTLISQQVQAPMTTLTTPQQVQPMGMPLTPQQAQALETTLTPQQAQVLETTLTPQQAQALMTTLTPQQVQALETSLTPQQVQALGTTLTPQLAQAPMTTLTPQQAQVLETTLTPQQVQAMGTPLTPQQAQILGTTLTPQQAQALMTTLTPQLAQALETSLTPQQAQALTIQIIPEMLLDLAVALPHEQAVVTSEPAPTLRFPIVPRLTQTLKAAGTLQIQEGQIPPPVKQSQLFRFPRTQEQTELAQATGATHAPMPVPAMAPPLTSVQGHSLEIPLTFEQFPVSGVPPTPGQSLELEALSSRQLLPAKHPQAPWLPTVLKTPLTPWHTLKSELPPLSGKSSGHWAPRSPQEPLVPGASSIHGELLKAGSPALSGQPAFLPSVAAEKSPALLAPSALGQHLPRQASPPTSEHLHMLQIPSAAEKPRKGLPSSDRKKRFPSISFLKSQSLLAQPSVSGLKTIQDPFSKRKIQISKGSDTPGETPTLKDSSATDSLRTLHLYPISDRAPVSQIPGSDETPPPTLQKKPRPVLPPLTLQLPRTPQMPAPPRELKSCFPSLDKPWIKTLALGKEREMMVPPPTPQEPDKVTYFVNVEAQRKNLILLNEAMQTLGLPPQLLTIARNLIIELLRTDTIRLGFFFHKYIAYRLIQRVRNNIIHQIKTTQNTGKGYEARNLYITLSRIDDYQKKIMRAWAEKLKSLEEKRNQCLGKMTPLFTQLREMYKLNLSRPILLIPSKKETPASAGLFKQPLQELPIEKEKLYDKKIRQQEDQLRSIWNADLSSSSYPIIEKTPVSLLWAKLGGFPDIPRLLQLDIQSTFRKSLACLKSRSKKTPK